MARNGALEVLGYSPAELHIGKCCYVDYYTFDEKRGRRRHKHKLNKIKDLVERKAFGRHLVHQLNAKLRQGWRPKDEPGSPKGHYTMRQALSAYLEHKCGELSKSSPQYYRSWCGKFERWCHEKELLGKPVRDFDRQHALAYMDHCASDRKLASRSWNNERTFMAMLFNWLVEREYRPDNPFKTIRKRKEDQKTRRFLTEDECRALADHLSRHDPDFYLVCLYVYHTLIRPRELCRLRVGQVDLTRRVIMLRGDQTKNGREASIGIPDAMMPWLLNAGIDKCDPEHYLVGARWRPGPVPAHRNAYSRAWGRLRKALKWGADKQLYSLRDTGILQLLRDGCDLVHVMQQARHGDVSITNTYLRHAFPKGIEQVQRKATALALPGVALGGGGLNPRPPASVE